MKVALGPAGRALTQILQLWFRESWSGEGSGEGVDGSDGGRVEGGEAGVEAGVCVAGAGLGLDGRLFELHEERNLVQRDGATDRDVGEAFAPLRSS